jgi:hypothetical protein
VTVACGEGETVNLQRQLGLIILVSISLLPVAAQAQGPGRKNVEVDDDGTVHLPAQAVPVSSLLSPEAKAYVARRLKDLQNPQMLGDNGLPRYLNGYIERQKVLYPVDREDTKIAGVHAYVPGGHTRGEPIPSLD